MLSIKDLEMMDKEMISVQEAAEIIECDPQRLRDSLDMDDHRPEDQKKFRFVHVKVGNRRRISRVGFIRWIRSEI